MSDIKLYEVRALIKSSYPHYVIIGRKMAFLPVDFLRQGNLPP